MYTINVTISDSKDGVLITTSMNPPYVENTPPTQAMYVSSEVIMFIKMLLKSCEEKAANDRLSHNSDNNSNN